jgi:dihydroorotate dehydrogenase (NAD+) catalytic subunit
MADVTLRTDPAPDLDLDVDMSATLGGLVVPEPVFTASGCAAAGQELAAFNDLTAIGGVVTKSIQLAPRSGRATPRMAETPAGMLNSIGLQGPGIDAFLDKDLRWLAAHDVRAAVSIAGGTVDDYAKLTARLRGQPVALIEVNISCPNVEDRGQVFACDANAAGAVVTAVRRSAPTGVPVFAKLSPDVTDIVAIARACVDAGADGLSLVNTTLGLVVDTTTMRPVLAGVTGGLSGPAIRPIALRCVWQVHAALPDTPIIGIGGIRTGLDALEFVLAGASAVQVGTVIFNDPSAPTRITRELRRALAERGIARLADVVGLAHRAPALVVPEDADPPGDEPPEPEPTPRPIHFEEA